MSDHEPERASRMRRTRTISALTVLAIWATFTLFYAVGGGAAGLGLLAVFAGATIAVARLRPDRAWMVIATAAALGTGWFVFAEPRTDREWLGDVERQPTATIAGDVVTVHDVRNFRYRSVDDFDAIWEDRTYDLRDVETVDLWMCYWDGKTRIAHTMLSFGFAGGEYLTLSVEIRREVGEDWSTVGALGKQFEIVYLLADERDVVGVRAGPRSEELFLYRLDYAPAQIRAYLELVLARCNELAADAEFYDPVDYNCSSALALMADELWPDRARQSGFDAYLNGNMAQNAYDAGMLMSTLAFDELKPRSNVAAAAREHIDAPDFSARIRAGLPK